MNSYTVTVKNESGQHLSGQLYLLAPDFSETGAVVEFTSPYTFTAEAAPLNVGVLVDGFTKKVVQLQPGANTVTFTDTNLTGVTVSACRQFYKRNPAGVCSLDWIGILPKAVMLLLFFAFIFFIAKKQKG